jgi:hypothetical protein
MQRVWHPSGIDTLDCVKKTVQRRPDVRNVTKGELLRIASQPLQAAALLFGAPTRHSRVFELFSSIAQSGASGNQIDALLARRTL